jgi:hypothetical protein
LLDAARALIADAKQELARRFEEDRRLEDENEALLAPFLAALQAVGCAVKEALVRDDPYRPAGPRSEPPLWIRVEGMPDTGMSSFPRFLGHLFDTYLPAQDIDDCTLGFDDVTVPAGWPPDRVAAWLLAAREENSRWQAEEEEARVARIKREEATVEAVRSLLSSG